MSYSIYTSPYYVYIIAKQVLLLRLMLHWVVLLVGEFLTQSLLFWKTLSLMKLPPKRESQLHKYVYIMYIMTDNSCYECLISRSVSLSSCIVGLW